MWGPHDVHRLGNTVFLELVAAATATLGKGVVRPHSDVAWPEPHKYSWTPAAARVTWSDASPWEEGVINVAVAGHGSPTSIGAIHATVPEE